jgi:hypothetical protein
MFMLYSLCSIIRAVVFSSKLNYNHSSFGVKLLHGCQSLNLVSIISVTDKDYTNHLNCCIVAGEKSYFLLSYNETCYLLI